MITQLKFWLHVVWYKLTHKLTPKGKQFKKYCKDILSGKNIPLNNEFENLLEEVSKELKVSREQALYFYYEFMDGMYK